VLPIVGTDGPLLQALENRAGRLTIARPMEGEGEMPL
jgi:hypothetical protein